MGTRRTLGGPGTARAWGPPGVPGKGWGCTAAGRSRSPPVTWDPGFPLGPCVTTSSQGGKGDRERSGAGPSLVLGLPGCCDLERANLPALSSLFVTWVCAHHRGLLEGQVATAAEFSLGMPTVSPGSWEGPPPATPAAASVSSSAGGPKHPTPLRTWPLFARRMGHRRPRWVA